MSQDKYSNLIVTELKAPENVMAALPDYNKRVGKRILWVDSNVVEGSFQMNCSWYLYPTDRGPEAHTHDVDEILGFFGSDPDDPYDLGGEVEFWIDDEPVIIDHSALVFIPAGVKHSPLLLRKVDRPIIHFSEIKAKEYLTKSESTRKLSPSEVKSCVVTELKIPPEKMAIADDYARYAKRILWLDKHVNPEAFHINTAWYLNEGETLENVPHVHEDDDEIIGFIGSDPDHPEDLGGEIEIWLDDEKHVITRSSMIFVPAGLKHCPLILKRVDRPVFHFTTVPGNLYIKDELA